MLLKIHISIIFLLSLIFTSGLFAQNLGASRFSGSVNSTGADSFVIANNGHQQVYQTGTVPANGLSLQKSDMIQTGPGNYVEVQLDPSGAIIKLAENTSVIFNDLGSTNRPALITLLYGRMRIMNPTSNGTVTIQAGNAAIEFASGDMALDFAIIPNSINKNPQLQVSTLSGTAQVVSAVASPGGAKTPLYEHETVIFDVTTQLAVITRQPLNQEILAYWSRNGFRQAGMTPQSSYLAQGGQPSQSPLPALGAYPATTNTGTFGTPASLPRSVPVASPVQPSGLSRMSSDRATLALKNSGVFWGMMFTAVGILAQSVAHYNLLGLDEDLKENVFAFGYAPIGIGVITLVATYMYIYRYSNQGY
jgi:hypothetical protein